MAARAELPLESGTKRLSEKFSGNDEHYTDDEDKSLLDVDIHRGMDGLVDLIVYLRDRTGIYYSLEDGQLARTEELLSMTLEEQGLSELAKDVFALWLVSDILEIRLKKNHLPYQIVQQWDELCALYTDYQLTDIANNEPVLMVQRDVFFPLNREIEINNKEILCLLYHEAKYNVLESRYAMFPEDYHQLAGIQALIHLGKYNPKQHLPVEYRSNIHKFYPDHMFAKEKFLFFTKKDESAKCEEEFHSAHVRLSREYQNIDIEENQLRWYKMYLDICRSYPFYGSVFFSGQVETPSGKIAKLIKYSHDTKVLVGINTEGISIIDKDKVTQLIFLPFDEVQWEYKEAEFDVDSDVMPSLYLQFLVGRHTDVTKLLQIYSRKAKLMNALINTCVTRKKMSKIGDDGDCVDGGVFKGISKSKLENRLDRFCLTTYSKQGECID